MRRSTIPQLFAAVLVLLVVSKVEAQRIHHIESVQPRVAQRGTKLDVVIRGVQLAEPREIIFYRPGIPS